MFESPNSFTPIYDASTTFTSQFPCHVSKRPHNIIKTFLKTFSFQFFPFCPPENIRESNFLPRDTHTYVCIRGKEMLGFLMFSGVSKGNNWKKRFNLKHLLYWD